MTDEEAQAAKEQEAQAAKEAEAAQAAAEEKGLSKEKADEIIAQKRKANKEAQEYKKRTEALEAELQAIKEKDLSEKEKAEARAKKLEIELEKERTERAHLTRVNTAISQGIQPEYTDYIALELAKAEKADDADFNASDWFAALKEKKPAFFGGNGTPPPGSGGGGPVVGKQGKAAELDAIKKEIALLLPHRHHQGNEMRIFNLSAKAEKLAKELSS